MNTEEFIPFRTYPSPPSQVPKKGFRSTPAPVGGVPSSLKVMGRSEEVEAAWRATNTLACHRKTVVRRICSSAVPSCVYVRDRANGRQYIAFSTRQAGSGPVGCRETPATPRRSIPSTGHSRRNRVSGYNLDCMIPLPTLIRVPSRAGIGRPERGCSMGFNR